MPEVSDAEVASFYEANAKQSGQPLEAIKPRIVQYLGQQKQQQAVQKEIERLKSEAGVKIDLPAPEMEAAQFDLAGKPFKGKADAKLTVVEFSDFQCPYCARAVSGVEELVKAYPDDVKVYFLHFPLNFHQSARPAAIASNCAHRQGKFWPFHDKIFEKQSALGDQLYADIAKEIGLDADGFTKCLGDPAVASEVERDMKQGEAAGVQGTPSFYINGIPHAQGIPSPEDLKQYLD